MAENHEVSRRDVLKTAGAVTAVAAVLPAIEAPFIQKVKAANDKVQYGFIGTGSRGCYLLNGGPNPNEHHLRDIDTGVCMAICDNWDVSLKKGLNAVGRNVPTYADYRELLDRKDIDAVFIAVPVYEHFPLTRDALNAGKHVFCEKSLVFKPEEVHELRALSTSKPNQVMQVGLQRRYSQFYQMAKDMIAQGILGNVTHIRGQWHRNSSQRRPVPDPKLERKINWRMYREYSGGNTAELASHQIDVADWMFGATPEFVLGLGGLDTFKDGRDWYDNIQLIYQYPGGRKLLYSSISTNGHLDLLQAERQEFGEVIMGTAGTIEITVGDDAHPCTGLWYREPAPVNTGTIIKGGSAPVPTKAGATMTTAAATRGVPLLLPKDSPAANDPFLSKEAKFARRWLYSKGIMVPEEDYNPVDGELRGFLDCCKDPVNKKPKSNLEVGLNDSISVILSNLAMDEGRRVYYNEIEKMGRGPETTKTTTSVPKPGVHSNVGG
ncbi:MAG TPA: Gfo/Idh/MocA family oxidoreductase [Candidatus Limnocylindrales bacterium]|nr:Gfo/Idh/MocA family oxidoreductase [Candidatus Limnocylindrales bacterium]